MKAALTIFCVGLASLVSYRFYCVNDKDKTEARKNIMQVIADCKKGHVSDERARLILRHEATPETEDEKCTSSCVMLKAGLIKDGKINPEGWKRIATVKRDGIDNSIPDKVAEVAKACQDKVADSDPCELASKALKCIFKIMEERGIPQPDFPQ